LAYSGFAEGWIGGMETFAVIPGEAHNGVGFTESKNDLRKLLMLVNSFSIVTLEITWNITHFK
jgi:hypothetical protein